MDYFEIYIKTKKLTFKKKFNIWFLERERERERVNKE